MTNLISTFIDVVTADGALLADAIRDMNSSLGVSYTNSRLREWERGDRCPTPVAMDYMLGIVLLALLERDRCQGDLFCLTHITPSRISTLPVMRPGMVLRAGRRIQRRSA